VDFVAKTKAADRKRRWQPKQFPSQYASGNSNKMNSKPNSGPPFRPWTCNPCERANILTKMAKSKLLLSALAQKNESVFARGCGATHRPWNATPPAHTHTLFFSQHNLTTFMGQVIRRSLGGKSAPTDPLNFPLLTTCFQV